MDGEKRMEDCTLSVKGLAILRVEYVLWGLFIQNQDHISYTETLRAGIAT
jgi:hypothetical protein